MKTLAALALALVLLPRAAPAEQLTACVSRSGSMYLIGPTYRRQSCTSTQTPLTFNSQGPGSHLTLVDSASAEVGLLVSHDFVTNSDIAWDSTLHVFLPYDASTGALRNVIPPLIIVYTDVDCGEQQFTFAPDLYSLYRSGVLDNSPLGYAPGLYRITALTSNVTAHSYWDGAACAPASQVSGLLDATRLATVEFIGMNLNRPAPLSIAGP